NPREEKTAEFICWSSTRAGFSLAAREDSGDPCVRCSCTLLTEEERGKQADERIKTRVLAAYRVRVVVSERLSESQQMDLGPFSRRVTLTSDPGIEPIVVHVQGVVRGEVSVGNEEDKGKIALGTFPVKRGVPDKRVRLASEQAGLDLELDRVEPEGSRYLKVKSLKKIEPAGDGRARWELAVEVPAGCPSGKLPDHCAVLLRIPGKTPRHIRIPVTGMAYQRSGE